MVKYAGEEYKPCAKYIEERHAKGIDWNLIRYITSKTPNANHRFLLEQLEDRVYEGWPELTIDEWFELFDEKKTAIEEYEAIGLDGWVGVATGGNHDINLMEPVYNDPNSCWNRYIYKLEHISKFSELTRKMLREECEWIVRNLKQDTDESVKGLVVGNVQSGKTANMAGVGGSPFFEARKSPHPRK